MANNSLVVPFNNDIQDADGSLEEAMQAVAAINNGNRPSVAEIVRDPSTGKLIQVRLIFPDTVGQAAVDAINDNPGVVTTCLNLPIPPSQVFKNLNAAAPDGIVWSGGATAPVLTSFNFRNLLGGGAGSLTSSGFSRNDVGTLTLPFSLLVLRNVTDTGTPADFELLASQTITLNFADGDSLVISPVADIVVPAGRDQSYWIDAAGKLYLRAASGVFHTYDFSTSCLGPV